jgi:short-subunit dehydrogenase
LNGLFPLKGGVAVVTGAASGIGAALSAALAVRGCNLALADRDPAGLAATAAACVGVTVSTHVLDIADRDAILALPDAVLAAHGRVTILVNNAGVALGGQFAQLSLDDFAWVIDINLWGVVRTTHAFLPILRAQPTAQIVNLSSIFGIIAPAGQTAYSASKFAVRGFSEALRAELATTGVGVTIVHPGGVATSIARSARRGQGVQISPDEEAAMQDRMKRFLKMPPPEAAAIILNGIERRQKRVLVGRDARMMALVQWLFPVGYHKVLALLAK